jgi:hypothetical protein
MTEIIKPQLTDEQIKKVQRMEQDFIDQLPAAYRACRFIIQNGGWGLQQVSIAFINFEHIMFQDEAWSPDLERSAKIRLSPLFDSVDEAYDWIKVGGINKLFSGVIDEVLVMEDEHVVDRRDLYLDDRDIRIEFSMATLNQRHATIERNVKKIREEIKSVTGHYPQDVMREQYDRVVKGLETKKTRKAKASK